MKYDEIHKGMPGKAVLVCLGPDRMREPLAVACHNMVGVQGMLVHSK